MKNFSYISPDVYILVLVAKHGVEEGKKSRATQNNNIRPINGKTIQLFQRKQSRFGFYVK